MKKVLFISSTGGHFNELMQLESMFEKYDYHIITEKTKTSKHLKKKYRDKIDFLIYGTKSHPLTYPFKLIANCFKSAYFYLKVHPDYIITTGVHTAGPMCLLGKIFGSRVIYIETFANMVTKTVTGRLLYPFSDCFIVQWSSMKELYPKAIDGGWIY